MLAPFLGLRNNPNNETAYWSCLPAASLAFRADKKLNNRELSFQNYFILFHAIVP
jgi:hypothetical protein